MACSAEAGGFIRPARAGDAAAIARILRGDACPHVLSETPERTRARVREGLLFCGRDEGHTVFVAENGKGRAAGFVAVAWTRNLRFGIYGLVSELFVHSRWRGQGLGSRLLDAVKAEARRRGCQRLLYSKDGDPQRRGFYAKRFGRERGDAAFFVFHLNLEGDPLPPGALHPER
ncbi:MAG: GNAT family N-acetyltransferase [Deinococcota bacterium]|jgi:GNAT superfamily N-acetyltransferase|nr:GNAT family N-acetyltransferase [Deinococcota bacterium]